MHKRCIHSAIGKGRPISTVYLTRSCASRFHTSTSTSKDEDQIIFPDVPTKAPPSRAERLKAASNEVSNLYQRSASRPPSNPASSSLETGHRTFKIDYTDQQSSNQIKDLHGQSSAPASLKERLRQRAAERASSSQPSQSNRPENRLSRPITGRRRQADPRPKRRERRPPRSNAEAADGNAFVGHEYVDQSPEAQNVALLEKVLLKQQERDEAGEDASENLMEVSDDEKEYEKMMRTRAVKPDIVSVVEMPKGPHNETLGSGLKPSESVERLMAMAGEKSKGQWAGVRAGEEQDVDALSSTMSAGKGQLDDEGQARSEASATAVMDRLVGGRYELPHGSAEQVIGNIYRGLTVNKSYNMQDGYAFIKQFEKIVGSADIQPKGKVGEAVKAGAQEGAMKKERRARRQVV